MAPRTNSARVEVAEVAEVADVTDILRIDFVAVDIDLVQFHQEIRVERQHSTGDPDTNNDDLVTKGKIALATSTKSPIATPTRRDER